MERREQQRGFTLVEILVVISVLAIMSAVAIWAVQGNADKATGTSCTADAHSLQDAEDAYHAEHQSYASEAQLVAAHLVNQASRLHDIAPASPSTSYFLVGVGECETHVDSAGTGGP